MRTILSRIPLLLAAACAPGTIQAPTQAEAPPALARSASAVPATLPLDAQNAAAGANDQPQSARIDWQSFARQDVQGAYEIYKREHPGMLDPANPGFPALLERARAVGLVAAENASDHAGYSLTLSTFSAELNDGHAQATSKPLPAGQAPPVVGEWPGFLTVWRDGSLVVRDTAPASELPTGTRIVSCDGLAIRDFVARFLRTRYIRSREEGQFWARAPLAFYTRAGSPGRARTCRVQTPDGAERDHVVNWVPAPQDFGKRLTYAVSGDRRPTGITEPRPGLFHIALPDFNPNEEGVTAYKALYAQLERDQAELSKARAIVLDLRHNNGGSSSWSRGVAERLWGAAEVKAAVDAYFAGTEIWWRPTSANIAKMQEYAALARRRGELAGAERQDRLVAELAVARDRGDEFYVQKTGSLPLSARVTTARPTSLSAPVYVIIQGDCASACLDAVDVFTRFRGVKLIGAPSSGDSTYMDIRVEDLPSGHGRIIVPMKIWVNRPRGNGEIYQPHLVMRGLNWSTEAFLDEIERDLRQRPSNGS